MLGEQWHLGLMIGALAVHALITYRIYRMSRRAGSEEGSLVGAAAGGADAIDREEGIVECRNCGTENELGYRYCRSCVGELSGHLGFEGAPGNPLGRLSR